jgi:hypothetical protein
MQNIIMWDPECVLWEVHCRLAKPRTSYFLMNVLKAAKLQGEAFT